MQSENKTLAMIYQKEIPQHNFPPIDLYGNGRCHVYSCYSRGEYRSHSRDSRVLLLIFEWHFGPQPPIQDLHEELIEHCLLNVSTHAEAVKD